MAISRSTMAVVATTLLLAAMTAVEGAGKAAPAPVDCTSVVLSMADCLSYVTNGSNVEKPEGSCCSGLKSVLKSAPECLCQSFKNSAQFGVVLNVTKALSLPAACHVHTPSLSSCGLSLSPAGAPAVAVVSPAGAPSSPMAGAPSMGITGAMAPASAPAGAKTGASSTIGISIELIIAAIATAFFSSF